MNKYEKKILEKLVSKYEKQPDKSVSRIKIPINKIFKDYVDNKMPYSDFLELNEIINNMQSKSIIKAIKEKNDDRYKYIELEMSNIDNIYSLLNKQSNNEKIKELENLLKSYLNKHNILDLYIKDLLQDLSSNKITGELKDINKLKIILKGLLGILSNQEPIKYREFSQTIYKDSKIFENEFSSLVRILKKYNISFDEETDETILNSFNIFKNPTMIMFKGNIALYINGEKIDVSKIKGGIAISSESLNDISKIEIKAKNLFTIENQTSYFSFNKKDSVIIYLAGFMNSSKVKLLKKIYENNSNVDYYHFGDIDAGGFYIYYDLVNKTNIPFKMYQMGINELTKFKEYTKVLTQKDKNRLESIKSSHSKISDVIDYMLKNNCKLEQEIIY